MISLKLILAIENIAYFCTILCYIYQHSCKHLRLNNVSRDHREKQRSHIYQLCAESKHVALELHRNCKIIMARAVHCAVLSPF